MTTAMASGSRTTGKGHEADKGKETEEIRRILTKEILGDFLPSRVFTDAVQRDGVLVAGGKKQITSICFEADGRACITAGEDDRFSYYDVTVGKMRHVFSSGKYGVDHVTATHTRGSIIHASTRGNDDVRLHVADQNKYERYFKGHTDKVCSISMNPDRANKTFLTGSHDATVLVWDQRSDQAVGRLSHMDGPSIVEWDSTGQIWAVALPETSYIMLYSSASFDVRPFQYVKLDDPEMDKESTPPRVPRITSLRFSNNGEYLVVGTSSSVHYVLDAFDLAILARLKGHEGLEKDKEERVTVKPSQGLSGGEVCWTPDSRFVMSGSRDGRVCVWDLTPPEGHEKIPHPVPPPGGYLPPSVPTFHPCNELNEEKSGGPTRVVAFSPKYLVFATAGDTLALWLPSRKTAEEDDGDNMDIIGE